ncbi:MAG: prolipoprotein diacylglyceryl transferase [Candidatus Omnitrophota bacterium]|jgi:phosphatidylglycerol:prolipoprotein diacylglycerol transferase|nr:MAG: prolipoprotein diacylglyceryl transferase [Candidatus Omnitrophota bacterium]
MHPHLINLFGVEITTYGLMVAVAFALLWWNVVRRGIKIGYEDVFLQNLLTIIVISAMAGSRVLLVIVNWDYYAANPSQILFSREAGVYLGGFLAAILFSFPYIRKHDKSILGIADLFSPYLALSHGIGRIGCFLFGCCYGSRCNLPWAVQFPQDSPAFVDQWNQSLLDAGAMHSLPVHPTQLYSAFFNFTLCILLLTIRKRQRFRGQLAFSYLTMYGGGRFLIEFVRGDQLRGNWGWFSTSQWGSFLLLCIGLIGYIQFRRRAVPPEYPIEKQTSPAESTMT